MKGFLSKFKVPDAALPAIKQIVTAEEIQLIEALDCESFSIENAQKSLEKATSTNWSNERVIALLRSAYKRGVILLEDENFISFRTGTFYGRLDIFALTETEKYLDMTREVRIALDDWYFHAYLDGLKDDPQPTKDKVVTLQEALEYIDAIDSQIWLNPCDCRTLAGNCDKPTDTCISFRNGINTMSHRGWSKPISKEEAKAVIRQANADGLMQTVNPSGMCNCCGDCCYLFRAQKARNKGVIWPAAEYIASFVENLCKRCGQCVKRCHFDAFTWEEGKIRYDLALCRGCGLCVEICPAEAITLAKRTEMLKGNNEYEL